MVIADPQDHLEELRLPLGLRVYEFSALRSPFPARTYDVAATKAGFREGNISRHDPNFTYLDFLGGVGVCDQK